MDFREIIDETALLNPSISVDSLSNAIVSHIENVLPAIIRQIRIPTAPSAIEKHLRDLRLERTRKIGRKKLTEKYQALEAYIGELAYLKDKLDGGSSTSIYDGFVKDDNDSFHPFKQDYFQTNESQILGPQSLRTNFPEIFEKRLKQERKILKKFKLHSNIAQAALHDSVISTFISVIEIFVRQFDEKSTYDWAFELVLPNDPEFPDWHRIVLAVKPPELEFDLLMKFWKKLGDELRLMIDQKIEFSNEEDRLRFNNLKDSFYVKVFLG